MKGLEMLRKRAALSSLFALASLFFVGETVTGCNSDASVSKSDEEKFKNPPKQMPKEASEYMKSHPGNDGQPAGAK